MFEIYDSFWITLWLTNEGLNYQQKLLAKKSGLDQSGLGNPWSQID